MLAFWLLLAAYLIGSFSSAVLVCRAMGLPDPRLHGSGNPGTTNVLRTAGREAALLTLAGDLGKGALAILLAILAGAAPLLQGWCLLAVVCGHLFPLFNNLKGGKGVATTLGAMLLLYWPLALAQLLCWCLIFALSRIASLASIATALVTPLFCLLLLPELLAPVGTTCMLLLLRHGSNMRKLLSGREHRF